MNSDNADGVILSSLVWAVLCIVCVLMLSSGGRQAHVKSCRVACGRSYMKQCDDGLCLCSNGSVYGWQEGYTRRLGGK